MPAKKYSHINFKPTAAMAKAAERGLEYRKKGGGGGLTSKQAGSLGIGSGVSRASSLKRRSNVSPQVVRRMKAFFDRHEKNSKIDKGKKPHEDRGYVAWLLWGGNPGRSWANARVRQMDAADKRAKNEGGLLPLEDLLSEIKKGDTVSYKKNGKNVTGKVVVPDARGPLVGIDPSGPDEMDMVPEDEISESDKPHLKQYGAPQGSKRDKQLDQTQADLKKAAELKKQGKTKQAEKLKQKAYRRRERMEKKERSKKSFRNVPRKDTKNESRDLQRIRSIIREELSKKTKATLRKKAEERGFTPGSVEQEYKKGLAAWASSGSRKGMSQHQWAMARVNSATPSKKWAVVKKSKAKKKK